MEKCSWCDGIGKFKQPNDEEKYSDAFDKYDAQGIFNMEECRAKALKEVGYTLVKCSHCNGIGEI
ncbi:MAG: hypothetical protein J5979_03845 [Lachnospiraceae bacterium]|nr:hypothetical protein [Lachnospiraceae bacterium]